MWPFHNYCGKTHATEGIQLGLVRKSFLYFSFYYNYVIYIIAPQPQASDSTAANTCIIPGCSQPKYVESDGKTHPYCGKSHAALAKQLGIFRE